MLIMTKIGRDVEYVLRTLGINFVVHHEKTATGHSIDIRGFEGQIESTVSFRTDPYFPIAKFSLTNTLMYAFTGEWDEQ